MWTSYCKLSCFWMLRVIFADMTVKWQMNQQYAVISVRLLTFLEVTCVFCFPFFFCCCLLSSSPVFSVVLDLVLHMLINTSFPLFPQLPTHREAFSHHLPASPPPSSLRTYQRKEACYKQKKQNVENPKATWEIHCLKILSDPCKRTRILTSVSGVM